MDISNKIERWFRKLFNLYPVFCNNCYYEFDNNCSHENNIIRKEYFSKHSGVIYLKNCCDINKNGKCIFYRPFSRE